LSSEKHPLGPAYRAVRRNVAGAIDLLHRVRRVFFIARVRVRAGWQRSKIDLEVAPDVRLARGIELDIAPRIRMKVRLGPRTRVDERVLLQLKGGTLHCGPDTWFRRDVVLNVSGDLVFVEGNIMSWGTAVHCAESVRFEPLASAAEGVTVSDSSHFFTTPDTFFYMNTRTKPVVIGANTWLCPKSTVTQGVRIGSHCILASNSVAIVDVPDGHLASGVPARDIRPLSLPWNNGEVGIREHEPTG
jgi:acetyltransferase-like isoleucine patch superfamily enzyme